MSFSPTRSLHLALSHSTKNSSFSHPKIIFPKSLMTAYHSKSLILAFHSKLQVSSQNFSQPRLMIKNRSSSSLTQHNNINNSPQIIKIHNSPLMTNFLQNSLKQQQLNHNFTNNNPKV